MATPLKILFLSAEVVPFAKTGGLGDVGGALPKFLRALGHDVRVVLPAYRAIETDYYAGRGGYTAQPEGLLVPVRGQGRPAGVLEGRLPGTDVPVYFIGERSLFDRPELYGYDDDVYRFAFYSRAALVLAESLGWRPDLVHAHDWHSAPALTWLATAGQASDFWRGVASLFTIHNLAHQGRASWDIFNYLGLSTTALHEEPYGSVNFMARGIYHATLVNTVSPTYAREIMTPAGGAGLDGLLRHRAYDVHGLLNRLDYSVWNPATDRRLAVRYDADRLAERAGNKRALQERAGLPVRPDVPLVAMVSRLDWQKGLDLLGHVVHLLLDGGAGEAQFVVLGSGAAEYEGMLAQLAGYHRDKMAAFLTYDADLAQLIYGGSDIFLMPSRFEPCGLGQLIAMRYGSVPVVRATGGLVDTVQEGVSGFSFTDYTTGAFWDALQRALYVYNVDRPRWQTIQHTGLTADYSWDRAAQGYQQVYTWALARVRGG